MTKQAERLRIVALISGRGSNLAALIDVCHGDFPARIVGVISNNGKALGLERAAQSGIASEVVENRCFAGREDFDAALIERIDRYQPGLVVLAGFMRILTERFVNHYQGRLMNIHPSLLPAFPGLHTHRRALESGATQHGATVHFVTPSLDAGPIIIQGQVAVQADDDEQTLAARVLDEEHRIYPQAVKWFAERRLALAGGQVLLDNNAITHADAQGELNG